MKCENNSREAKGPGDLRRASDQDSLAKAQGLGAGMGGGTSREECVYD